MTTTTDTRAVRGRRIELTYYRELPDGPKHPGIITSVDQASTGGAVWIRLDGTRCNLPASHDYEGLTYLDEVVPVPELPMGDFIPSTAHMLGVWEGVPLSTLGEDGEDLILLTDDRGKAWTAATAYFREFGIDIDPDYVDAGDLEPKRAVFTWEPEDAECPWTVNWDEAEDNDQAVHIFYLPA